MIDAFGPLMLSDVPRHAADPTCSTAPPAERRAH